MHRHFWPSKFSFGDTCRSQADSDYHPNPNPNPKLEGSNFVIKANNCIRENK